MRYSKLLFILATIASGPFAPGKMPGAGNAANHQAAPVTAMAQPAIGMRGVRPEVGASASAGGRPLLVCFGDSLTAGAGIDSEEAYPANLQKLLEREGYRYQVVNAGVSGDTTKDGLDRVDGVLRRHPQIVVVEFGGNDGLRGLSTAQAQHNLESIVQQLKASGARVAMAGVTLPAQYGGPYVQSFNAMFPAVAARYHVPLLPFILQDVYGIPGYIQEDGIHPTAKGAQQVAINVEKLVAPLLKK